MKLLALDTATEACSAAVYLGETQVYERFEIVQQQHSARILPMIQEVLAEAGMILAQLDAIAFGRGPGSFTGLRIGAGVAQGLALGVDLPVMPVSSLAALAQGQPGARILAAFDARMGQVYYGAYVRREARVELRGAEAAVVPQEVVIPEEGGQWIGAGSGWDHYEQAMQAHLHTAVTTWRRDQYPHAGDVARLGVHGVPLPAEQALPVYIRDDVAKKQR